MRFNHFITPINLKISNYPKITNIPKAEYAITIMDNNDDYSLLSNYIDGGLYFSREIDEIPISIIEENRYIDNDKRVFDQKNLKEIIDKLYSYIKSLEV